MNASMIKQIRKANGLTTREFAKAIGTNASTVSRWEQGKIKISVKHEKIISDLYVKTTFSEENILLLVAESFNNQEEFVQFITAYNTAEPGLKKAIKLILKI